MGSLPLLVGMVSRLSPLLSPSWSRIKTEIMSVAGCFVLPPVQMGGFSGRKGLVALGQEALRGSGGIEEPRALTSLLEDGGARQEWWSIHEILKQSIKNDI